MVEEVIVVVLEVVMVLHAHKQTTVTVLPETTYSLSIRNYRYVPVITDTYRYTLKVPNYLMLTHNAPHPPPTVSRIVIPLNRKLTSHTR